jgi:ABC-type uncharacterized transport system substrate-binding protein
MMKISTIVALHNVNGREDGMDTSSHIGFISNVLPEVQNVQKGVSVEYAPHERFEYNKIIQNH